MASSIKNVLVLGASGHLGVTTVRTLMKKGFKVTAVTRESSEHTFPDGITVLKGAYGSAEFAAEAVKGQDAVVSVVHIFGPTSAIEQVVLFEAAAKAGVKRIIPSDFRTSCNLERVKQVFPTFAVLDQVRAKLDAIVAAHPQTSWTTLQNGIFIELALPVGFMRIQVPEKTAELVDGGNMRVPMSSYSNIADAIAAVLARPARYQNQEVWIRSTTASQNEIVESAARLTATPLSKWTITHAKSADLERAGADKLARGDPKGATDRLSAVFFADPNPGIDAVGPSGLANEELGLPAETLDDLVQKVVDAQKTAEK